MQLSSPILIVCTGNLCRSPFAEHVLRRRLEHAGAYAEVFSRGLQNIGSQRVPDTAQHVAAEFGVDLSAHHSSPLSQEDMQRAALAWVMTGRQRSHISQFNPTAIGKVFLLSQPDGGADVADPVGQPPAVFREVFTE
ncbi:MAG: hypothetical protein R8K53_09790, partial [Mariprofundaceae bacterium]